MLFRTLRFQDRHKFVRQLKKFLNELVLPSPNLPDDDALDITTLKALKLFKSQWYSKIGIPLKTDDPYFEVNLKVWTAIGFALGKTRLLQELQNTQDYELRSLLMGLGTVNAMKVYYTKEMEECDARVASVFGGKNTIAAANDFEPYSLVIVNRFNYKNTFGFYYAGHLSSDSIHLYGSTDGTRFGVDGNTIVDLYIPNGFRGSEKNPREFRRVPGPEQASLDFYYEKLGNYNDVTLMVSHIKDFKLEKEGNRWRIGKIGGKGGSGRGYVHSHLDLFKGNVGMTGKRIRLSFAGAFC